jgi:hypothetical protein
MRKLISVSMAAVLMAGISSSLVGCSDESSVTEKREVKGPGGTSTETAKVTVEKTGSNPPTTAPKTP